MDIREIDIIMRGRFTRAIVTALRVHAGATGPTGSAYTDRFMEIERGLDDAAICDDIGRLAICKSLTVAISGIGEHAPQKQQRTPKLTTPVCKHCGSTRFAQVDKLVGLAKIAGLHPDGTIEWQGETEVDWDSQHPYNNPPEYVCMGCHEGFVASELGIWQEKTDADAT